MTSPSTPEVTLAPCPVLDLATDLLSCQQEILKKIRRFKNRTKTTCKDCSKYQSCEQLTFINQQIDTAIQEVLVEWGL